MASFIMFTKLGNGAVKSPDELARFSRRAIRKVEAECPLVLWKASCVVLGPIDYVDIFDAPDVETALKVAAVFRTFGNVTTDICAAAEWEEFSRLKKRRAPKRSFART
jgi:uncharacterized protein with GYD domain